MQGSHYHEPFSQFDLRNHAYLRFDLLPLPNNKLDLSEGTPESTFVNTVRDFVNNNSDKTIEISLVAETTVEAEEETQGIAQETTMPTAERKTYRPGTMISNNQRPFIDFFDW